MRQAASGIARMNRFAHGDIIPETHRNENRFYLGGRGSKRAISRSDWPAVVIIAS
jgi:hypothetical protein